MQKDTPLNALRFTALILLVCGALGSLSFTIYNGRNNKSFILVALFAGWVLLPFAALIWANLAAKNRAAGSRIAVMLAIIVTVGCLVAYSGLLSPPGIKLTGIFLTAPLVSWLVIGAGKLLEKKNG